MIKALITPEEWRGFCDSVVPLFKAKRIFNNTEMIKAELDLYDFGEYKIRAPVFDVKITDGDMIIYSAKTSDKEINVPLNQIKKSSILNVKVSVEGHENSWRIIVYSDENKKGTRIVNTQSELEDDATEVMAFKAAVMEYVESEEFSPQYELKENLL